MNKLCLFLALVPLLATLSPANGLKVSIYYESLCPDSIRFITTQLYPNYPVLADYITVDFVPYGKASQTVSGGEWQFSCQHGPNECYGNKMQACALDQNQSEAVNVDFVDCVMGSGSPATDDVMSTCASKGPISWDQVLACRDSGLADDLLAANGDRTNSLSPRITFVPTIIYDDVFSQENQDSALRNFLATTCALLGADKPAECST